MFKNSLSLAAFLTAATLAAPAVAAVDVTFKDSKRYTDVGRSGRDLESTTHDLQKTFEKLGQKYLASNQTLKIEILDIDLAGRDNVLQPPRDDIRVLRGGADWPVIKLHYELQTDGKTVLNGDDTISDMNYQMSNLPNSRSEPLYYENQMLARWFESHFGPKVKR